jgi:serine/threonine-protein kinase
MVVDYSVKGDSFVPGKPRLWSEAILWNPAPVPMFDVAPDGKRVAAVLLASDSGMEKPLTHVTFLLNFFDELRRKTAPGK